MSLSLFAVKNQWHKNGLWWFSKMLNRAVGEERYNEIRVGRRIWQNKVYYIRQHLLYRLFIESPDLSMMLGVYPKCDTSHGYGSSTSYEMYRDFQENTINSDGSFGMWIVAVAAVYCLHAVYHYFIPWYWNKTASCKNGEEQRVRMRDALNSTIVEDTFGLQILEWGFAPHSVHHVRGKFLEGLSHPDDVRAMHCAGLHRSNRYKQHYMGNPKHMHKRMIREV